MIIHFHIYESINGTIYQWQCTVSIETVTIWVKTNLANDTDVVIDVDLDVDTEVDVDVDNLGVAVLVVVPGHILT